jgi:hypothetical protein
MEGTPLAAHAVRVRVVNKSGHQVKVKQVILWDSQQNLVRLFPQGPSTVALIDAHSGWETDWWDLDSLPFNLDYPVGASVTTWGDESFGSDPTSPGRDSAMTP